MIFSSYQVYCLGSRLVFVADKALGEGQLPLLFHILRRYSLICSICLALSSLLAFVLPCLMKLNPIYLLKFGCYSYLLKLVGLCSHFQLFDGFSYCFFASLWFEEILRESLMVDLYFLERFKSISDVLDRCLGSFFFAGEDIVGVGAIHHKI